MAWSRDTKWRQGSVLDAAALKALGVACGPKDWAVVITHDCDLAQSNLELEPDVEIVLCEEVTALKKECLTGSVGRELHLELEDNSTGDKLNLAMSHRRKTRLQKEYLEDSFLVPYYEMSDKTRDILREWLSKRYNRHALPESLGDRIDLGLQKARDKLKKHAEDVVAVLISHAPLNRELPPSEDYDVELAFIFRHSVPDEGKAINASVALIQAWFDKTYRETTPGSARANVECRAYADTEFTLADFGRFAQIRWDDLSHRSR